MTEKQDPTISFLIEQKLLDQEVLATVIDKHRRTKQSLINILKDDNLLDEYELTRVSAAAYKIKFVNLSAEMIDSNVARLVSYKIVSRHNLIPIKLEADCLTVAMSSPLNLSVRDQIELQTGYKVVPAAATPGAIRQAIHYHFSVAAVTKQKPVSGKSQAQSGIEMPEGSDGYLEDTLAEATESPLTVGDVPVAELVSSIIRGAIDAMASDIHIEPAESKVRVRYRVDGILRDTANLPLSAQREVASHIKIMSGMDISERRVPQDGHMTLPHSSKQYDLRISSLPAVDGEKIVIRILDKSTDKWSLDEMVINQNDNEKFRSLTKNPYGMILLTGPTGSGKTTTLYSLLQLLNTPERNIVTIEDPVEYCLDGITQVQIKPVAGVTFVSTLRSILRQDPDVILIGEIRDLETAEIAVSAALTGHLVLSTLHTNDAVGAISRLINLGVAPFLVASSLLGTVAQRLVRTVCGKCRQSYEPSQEELSLICGQSGLKSGVPLYRGVGCGSCYQNGYSGRKAIYEILSVSAAIRSMIVDLKSDGEIKRQAITEGMKTLRESGFEDVLNGATTLEEVARLVDMRTE